MRIKKYLLVMVFVLSVSWVHATDYQVDIGFGVTHSDNADAVGLFGNYYFDEVNTDNVPLAEAAFLGRSNSIFGGFSHVNGNSFSSQNTFVLGANYYKGHFFVSPELYTTDVGFSHFSTFGVRVGYLPIDGLLISSYTNHQGWNPNINVKYVKPFGEGKAFSIQAEYFDFGGDNFVRRHRNKFSMNSNYYFNQKTSLGIAYSEGIGGVKDTSLRARHFFTPKLSTNLSVTNAELPVGRDETIVGIDVSFRY